MATGAVIRNLQKEQKKRADYRVTPLRGKLVRIRYPFMVNGGAGQAD